MDGRPEVGSDGFTWKVEGKGVDGKGCLSQGWCQEEVLRGESHLPQHCMFMSLILKIWVCRTPAGGQQGQSYFTG